MDYTIDLQALVEFIVATVGVIWAVAQMKNNTEHNKEAINELKELITKNSEETKEALNTYKDIQKESLSREINHIKDIINMNSSETKEAINRLENKQNESNRIKERLAIAEASLKSLHKRLDLDLPPFMKSQES